MSDEEIPVSDEAAPVEAPVDEAAQERERLGKEAQKRIARLTYEAREAQREVARLKAAQTTANPPSFEDQVKDSAAAMVAQQQFLEESEATYLKGAAVYPNFRATVLSLREHGMDQNDDFVEAVNALDNGHAVLNYLGENIAEATELLGMKPAKAAIRLAKISGELAKPVIKPISRTPAPPEPIGGKTLTARDPEKMSMAEYAEWFKERQKNRR